MTGFFSKQAPDRQKAEDLMGEYKYQNPRITTRIVDPVRSPGEARAYGIEFDGTIVVSTQNGEARITPPEQATEENLTNAVLKASAKVGEATAFMAELDYAAVVSLAPGLSEEMRERLVMVEVPRHLFPFARAILADDTRDGGFPPLMMSPIDFGQLYLNRRGAAGEAAETASGANGQT